MFSSRRDAVLLVITSSRIAMSHQHFHCGTTCHSFGFGGSSESAMVFTLTHQYFIPVTDFS